jgi:hypothetical protein
MDQEDLVGRLMADMDADLLHFLQTKANSFVKWDLLRFFHENPHTTDTAANIARYAGRAVETTEAGLIDLAREGVLSTTRLGEMTVYSLSNNPEIRNLLQRFVKASDDRDFRVKAVFHVIRSMR